MFFALLLEIEIAGGNHGQLDGADSLRQLQDLTDAMADVGIERSCRVRRVQVCIEQAEPSGVCLEREFGESFASPIVGVLDRFREAAKLVGLEARDPKRSPGEHQQATSAGGRRAVPGMRQPGAPSGGDHLAASVGVPELLKRCDVQLESGQSGAYCLHPGCDVAAERRHHRPGVECENPKLHASPAQTSGSA